VNKYLTYTLSAVVVFTVATTLYNYRSHAYYVAETNRRFAINDERLTKALREIDSIRNIEVNATRPLDVELNRQYGIAASRLAVLTIDVEQLKMALRNKTSTNN